MSVYLVLLGILLCLGLSAFCSAAEMSYSSCNVVRLENLRDDGSKRAGLAVKITERFDDALSTILIGNNLANIAASSLGSVLVILLLGSDAYAWAATVILTVLVIIFGETIPKITAKKAANTVALRDAYAVRCMMILLKPVVWPVVALTHLITGGEPAEEESDGEEAVEELQSIIETAEDEEVLDEDRSELVQAAIDFSEISAMEVMTARVDVCAIDIEDDWNEIVTAVEEAPFSRLPVYEGSIDNIIGVLYLNHFLKALTEKGKRTDIRKLLMQPCYVYKTMKLPAVLSMLRKAKHLLAVAQISQPCPFVLLTMEARHSLPHWGQSHQTTSALPGINKSGVSFPFLVGCHSFASSGYKKDKESSNLSVLYSKISALSLATFTSGRLADQKVSCWRKSVI